MRARAELTATRAAINVDVPRCRRTVRVGSREARVTLGGPLGRRIGCVFERPDLPAEATARDDASSESLARPSVAGRRTSIASAA